VDGNPLWSRDGMIAVANAFKGKVNVTFAYGAKLPDPTSSSIQATAATPGARSISSRAISKRARSKNLVRAAIDYNQTSLKKNAPKSTTAKAAPRAKRNSDAGRTEMDARIRADLAGISILIFLLSLPWNAFCATYGGLHCYVGASLCSRAFSAC